ncbi:hypothetical protein [Alienimonas sp. DA493]|uniref:hypothetical protein n=1 Tax=Alienimonas sp. DA493 TaxID=3373605 RepID=UPI003753FF86
MPRSAARLSALAVLLCPLAPLALVGCSDVQDGEVPYDESTAMTPEEQEAFDEEYLEENSAVSD